MANGEGIVTLDGIDMRNISPRWLYSRVAYVPQKPVIFDESIYYNLVYGAAGLREGQGWERGMAGWGKIARWGEQQ